MKIGVLTFWSSMDNYGQVLQGYALQKYLCSLGHEAFLIRYEEKKTYPDIFQSRSAWALFTRAKKYLLHHRDYEKQKKVFRKNLQRGFTTFKKGKIEYSQQRYHTPLSLQKDVPKADMYIVGSDQVWGRNPLSALQQPYYLQFGSPLTKRISYAASFGNNESFDDKPELLRTLLKGFERISVREETGKRLCEKAGLDVTWVLDPVLLLRKADYLPLIEGVTPRSEAYLYIYSVNVVNPEQIQYSQLLSLAKKKGWQVVVTPSSGYITYEDNFEKAMYDYCSIEGWLSNIYHASLVVTTSFHGVMFCLKFHKPFVYVPLEGRFSRGNDRVGTLLTKLQLTNRILKDNYENVCDQSIDWASVDSVLDEYIDNSKEFLRECGC
ncbi:MAG: polysaccharide pyruvyl transferase family protein [Bacteroidaceae bacterium]|nr:polysaccharide pyruvyl transferase family protein [Bacteroidaceae bacterium]